jgi:hypothetical protein
MFRKYKIFYQLYNFFNKSQLTHNLPFYLKYGVKKRYFSSVSSQDFKNISSPQNIFDAKDTAIELPNNSEFNALEERFKTPLLLWSKNGYAVLPNFYTENDVDAFNTEVDHLLGAKQIKFTYGNKIMFAIHKSALLKACGENKKMMAILELLMGKKVDLFQSINFLKGSQQRTHSDSIHMTTFPYGNLIAIWVALEDIKLESGPLHYYPGSHKLPYVMNADYGNVGTRFKIGEKNYSAYEDRIQEVLAENKLEKHVFLAKKGDVLIWHANLLHGGEKMIDPSSSRKSMVFHYYTNDSVCFHEISQRPTLKRSV